MTAPYPRPQKRDWSGGVAALPCHILIDQLQKLEEETTLEFEEGNTAKWPYSYLRISSPPGGFIETEGKGEQLLWMGNCYCS